jgi:hypothetical protein
MTSIVLIEHNGNIKNVKSKELTLDTLYKKCGFRSSDNFEKMTTWEVEHNKELVVIELWAKSEGKANNENKYDFPPPVDNSLYFGTCALIRVDNKGYILNLTSDVWLKVYEKLFGGFEDLDEGAADGEDDMGEEEEEEEEEVLVSKPGKKSKKKTSMADEMVEDAEEGDEDEDEGDEDEEGDEDGEVDVKKGKLKNALLNESEEEDIEDYYGSELEEEAYSYSDED